MLCIKCQSTEDQVVDSRMSKDGITVRRRRECRNCNNRYTTYEKVDLSHFLIIKKGGHQEELDRKKILGGLLKACEKRPVSMQQMDQAVDEIIEQLHREHFPKTSSKTIGNYVMQKLYQLDQVAYIRYASVYREFKNVNEFIQEIKSLQI